MAYSMRSDSIPAKWTPYILSITRIIFGFLIVRHGMEQWFGYPEASEYPISSFSGIVELVEFPAGLLLMLGVFTRPVALLVSVMVGISYFTGPALRGPWPVRNGGDPVIVVAFFFLFVSAYGAGLWSLDRLWKRTTTNASKWTPYALSLLQIAAGVVFFQHGIEKLFGFAGSRVEPDLMTIRGIGGILETIGGPLITMGLFTRVTAFILSGEMAVAYFRSWAPRGFWPSFSGPGMEASILFCYLYLFFFASGAGPWSLDALINDIRAKRRASARPETAQESIPTR
jgi:putative oxidoreductase